MIPLSSHLISQCMDDSSHDEEVCVINWKTTDFLWVTSKRYEVVFARFVDSEIWENLLPKKKKKITYPKWFSEISKKPPIFNVLCLYLETQSLSWRHCVGAWSDGGPSAAGSMQSFHIQKRGGCTEEFSTGVWAEKWMAGVLSEKNGGPDLRRSLKV